MHPPPNFDCRTKSIRVAWLLPTFIGGDYIQPVFSEFTRLLPNTIVITSCWGGFLPGYEGTFVVRELGGLRHITLKQNPEGYDKGLTWASPFALWELLRFRPHVIVTGGFNVWTLYALAFKALTRSRVIVLWEGTSPSVAHLDAPVLLRIRRIMAHFFDACMTNSVQGREYLLNVLAVPDSKLLRHPFEVPEIGVLCSAHNKGDVLQSVSHPVFLFVASLIERKGCRYLLEAATRLAQKGLGPFSVVFVGEGSQAEELRRLAFSLGLDGVVHFLGPVRYEKLGAYFRASDVFVLPTLEDTWGMVVLEAMACGKPVLCSKYANSKEMVEHGVSGFVFDPYNRQQLADYMAQFIQQPSLITQFGARSREIIAPYTPERSAKVLARLVVNVLDSANSS